MNSKLKNLFIYPAHCQILADNYISLHENSCQLDIEFKVTVDNEPVELPETYGPCEDVNRKFNLQAGDTINAYTTFTPAKKGSIQ